jgi:hypothetical protein
MTMKTSRTRPDGYLGRSSFLLSPDSRETRMPAWKVLFIMAFACVCLGLALSTVIVPFSIAEPEHKWLWFASLLIGTVCSGTLFTLFLQRADRAMGRDKLRRLR